MPTLNLGREPVAIITAFVVALGALNTQIAGLSPGMHSIISAILVILGAVLARSAVTPVAAPPAPKPLGPVPPAS